MNAQSADGEIPVGARQALNQVRGRLRSHHQQWFVDAGGHGGDQRCSLQHLDQSAGDDNDDVHAAQP